MMNSDRKGLQRGVWFIEEDEQRVATLAKRVKTGTGVLLYGAPGAGQEELGREVATLAAGAGKLINLGVADEVLENPIYSELQQGTVFYLPRIDQASDRVLDYLVNVLSRTNAHIVAVSTINAAVPDFTTARLLGLETVRIRDLNEEAGTRYLMNGLGAPLSDRASYAIWESAGGNRQRMKMIAEDWREAGYLTKESGVWVIRSYLAPAGPQLTSYWTELLDSHSTHVRDAFEYLALAGEVPISVLIGLCGPEAVDLIHDMGHLRIAEDPMRQASLNGVVNPRAVRSQVPPGRSYELLQRFLGYLEKNGHGRLPGIVHWEIACGLNVEPARAVSGAEHLLTSTSPIIALDILRTIPDEEETERADAVRLGAVLASGRFIDVWQVTDAMLPARSRETGEEPSPTTLLAATWEGNHEPILAHRAATGWLPPGLQWLWTQEVNEALVRTGKIVEGLSESRELMPLLEQSGLPPFLIRRARLGLFDQECAAGEWEWAAQELQGDWNAHAGPPGQGRTGTLYTAIADTLVGRFEKVSDSLSRELPQLRALGRHELLPLGNSMHALCLAKLGRRDEAQRALAEADIANPVPGVWTMMWAATFFGAHAMALLGRTEIAVSLLMNCADRDRELGNVAQELLTVSLAVQWDEEKLLPRLLELAGLNNGRFGRACHLVASGIQHGDIDSLEEGATLSASLGQYFFADYAAQKLADMRAESRGEQPGESLASQARDGRVEWQSAGQDDDVSMPELFAEQPGRHRAGHVELLGESAEVLTENEVVDAVLDGREAPRVEAEGEPLGDTATRLDIARPPGLALLTPRQRDIVSHVAGGMTNAEIAGVLGLSVRTVESHLYQIYARLNVTSRKELRLAVPAPRQTENG